MVELLAQSNLLDKQIAKSYCEFGLQAMLKVIFTLELIAKHALTWFHQGIEGSFIYSWISSQKNIDLFCEYLPALLDKENCVVSGRPWLGIPKNMLSQGEFLINLQVMACPSKAMILDVLKTDEDWVRIDGCLRRRDQPRNKLRHQPGQNVTAENCVVFCSFSLEWNKWTCRSWKEQCFSSFSKSCDLVT